MYDDDDDRTWRGCSLLATIASLLVMKVVMYGFSFQLYFRLPRSAIPISIEPLHFRASSFLGPLATATLRRHFHFALPQIHHFELQSWPFNHMPRSQRICVQPVLIVRVEDPRLPALQHMWQARRIRQAENAPIGIMSWCTNDRDGFGQHDLISGTGVEISRGEKTRLRRMSVDPAHD